MAIKESITYVMDLVDQYTGPAQKVMSSVSKMDEDFNKLTKQRERAGSIKSDLNNFDSLNRKLNINSESLSDARNEAKRLGKEISNTENPTKKQIAAFDKAKSSVSRLSRSQTKYRQEISSMNSQLVKAGVHTSNMGLAHRKADAEIKKLTKSLDRELKVLTEVSLQQAKIDKFSAKAKHIRGSITGGDVVAAGGGLYAVKKLAQEYGEVATAQGQLESLGTSDADIQAVTNKAREFSNEFAGFQQSELISASYDLKSGMSNLGGDALAGYLDISAQVAGGTKASIDQITGLMATGYGIYRDGFGKFAAENIKGWESLSADEKDIKFGEYFGAGIATAVQQFKTDGSQMTQAIEKIGKVAETSNVPMSEQLAILGTLQQTMSGSEAATKYKSFLNKAVLAGDKLSLSLTDQNNQLLSSVDIISQLKTKYGETLDDLEKAEIKTAFGTDEALAYITLMYDKTDELKKSTDNLSDSMAKGRDIYGDMANSIMKGGPSESIQLMNQATKNAMADLGYGFAPIIATVATVIGSASNSFGNFLRENGEFAEYIAIGTTALIALKVTTVASKFVLGGLFDLFAFGNKVLLWFRTQTVLSTVSLAAKSAATWIATSAQTAFNLSVDLGAKAITLLRNSTIITTAATWAMTAGVGALSVGLAILTSPITLIIGGIAALGAAGYMLYKNWDSVTSWISNAWSNMADNFVAVGGWISDSISGYFQTLFNVVMNPIQAMKDAYEWASGLFDDDEKKQTIEITKKVKTDTVKAGVASIALAAPLIAASDQIHDPSKLLGSDYKSIQQQYLGDGNSLANNVSNSNTNNINSFTNNRNHQLVNNTSNSVLNSGIVQPNNSIVRGGNISNTKSNGDITIQSNDTYEITIPETNDSEMVRKVLREELEKINRSKAREFKQVMYDS